MDAVSDLDMKPVGQSEIELERESEWAKYWVG